MSAVLTSHTDNPTRIDLENLEDYMVQGDMPRNGAVGRSIGDGMFAYTNPGNELYQLDCLISTHFYMNGDWWLTELELERAPL